MKLRNLFGLLLAMTLFVVGCTKTEVDNKPSKLNITSEYPMEFSARGGEGVITFTLDNPVAGAKVTATCEAEWIKYLTVAEGENKVTFYVERNTVEEGRETTIYVNYLETPYTVKVKQSAKDITVMSYESANRIPSAMYNLPNNNIITKFQVKDGDYIYALCLTFIVPEGENTLVEGTYSVADGTLNNNPELCQMMQVNVAGNEPELVGKYVFVDGSAEIWVTGDSYRIWSSLYDADGERYSYSYEGQITGIVPAEPTTVNATFCQGFAYEAEGGLYEYELFLSDMDFVDSHAQPGGNYFKFDLYGEPGVINGNLVTIPAGSYASIEDAEEGYVFAAGDINLANCWYANGPYNVDQMSFSAAFLEVTETGVSARVVTFADSEHFYEFIVNFEGAPTVEVPEGVEPGPGPELGEGVVFEALDCSGVCYGFDYGTTFNYYLYLSDAGFDEDGVAQPGGTYYQLDLYSVEGELDGEGNIIVAPGTYVLDPASTMAEWSISAAYSFYFTRNADGTDYEVPKTAFAEATLVVTDTNATLTAVIEGVQHEVTYNGQLKLPAPASTEPGEIVEVDVPYAYAYYFGDQYTPGYADNYYLFLSDVGLDEEGYELPNGTYYRFDLYAPIADSNLTKIPAGTYTIDMYDSGEPWTASLSYSGYYVLDEYGYDYVDVDYFGSGTIVVNEDGSVVAEVTMLTSGDTHKVTRAASDITIYEVTGGGENDDTYSTLTSDLVCNLSDHTLYYENYGDWYEVGYQNWTVAIMPNSQEGDFVQFDLLAGANSTEDFFGEYTISNNYGSYTSVCGYLEYGYDYNYLAGSWYYTNDGVTMAPFVDGWVEILDSGDGNASVEFEVWDDAGYFVKGACTCRLAPASELQSVTRSNAKFNSQVYAPKAETKVVEKSRIVAKNTQKSAAAVKGISLRK
ncbi:MAG: BACON domain-containing protein [Alistipes sp.]|nr:BACON domain-containing protein [Alistipes sp.]